MHLIRKIDNAQIIFRGIFFSNLGRPLFQLHFSVFFVLEHLAGWLYPIHLLTRYETLLFTAHQILFYLPAPMFMICRHTHTACMDVLERSVKMKPTGRKARTTYVFLSWTRQQNTKHKPKTISNWSRTNTEARFQNHEHRNRTEIAKMKWKPCTVGNHISPHWFTGESKLGKNWRSTA